MCKAQRLVYHSTPGSRVIMKKKKALQYIAITLQYIRRGAPDGEHRAQPLRGLRWRRHLGRSPLHYTKLLLHLITATSQKYEAVPRRARV